MPKRPKSPPNPAPEAGALCPVCAAALAPARDTRKWRAWPPRPWPPAPALTQLPWRLRERRKPALRVPEASACTCGKAVVTDRRPRLDQIRAALSAARNATTGQSLITMVEDIAIEGHSVWVVMRAGQCDAPITTMNRLAIEHALYALPAVTHVEILSSRNHSPDEARAD